MYNALLLSGINHFRNIIKYSLVVLTVDFLEENGGIFIIDFYDKNLISTAYLNLLDTETIEEDHFVNWKFSCVNTEC